MAILNEKYGMVEEDFLSAELMAVPAAKAVDIGLDRSVIGAYGQDDRVCAYACLKALLDLTETPRRTAICVLADKEEIGSLGVTGMQSAAFDTFMSDLCEGQGVQRKTCYEHSFCLSADVTAAYDPNFAEAYEPRNSAYINYGVCISKYTGARGKSGASDASAELVGYVRRTFAEAGVIWQLAELALPLVVLLVPQVILYSRIGWIDTLLPMIVPASLCNINNIFFLRQYMIGLPSGYLDAAKIDGCTYFGAYRRIFLPLSRTAIIANAIMLFMSTWNDYFGPLIFTHSASKQTVQVAIAMLNSHYEQQTDIPLVMAASLIAVLPVLILFITCQKHFTDSFAMSGIKG